MKLIIVLAAFAACLFWYGIAFSESNLHTYKGNVDDVCYDLSLVRYHEYMECE
jgi:hypothetical protein